MRRVRIRLRCRRTKPLRGRVPKRSSSYDLRSPPRRRPSSTLEPRLALIVPLSRPPSPLPAPAETSSGASPSLLRLASARGLTMTPLCRRMIQDMTLRNFAPRTITVCVDCVARFARHFGKSPGLLGADDVRAYLLYLIEQRQGPGPTAGPPLAPQCAGDIFQNNTNRVYNLDGRGRLSWGGTIGGSDGRTVQGVADQWGQWPARGGRRRDAGALGTSLPPARTSGWPLAPHHRPDLRGCGDGSNLDHPCWVCPGTR